MGADLETHAVWRLNIGYVIGQKKLFPSSLKFL